MNLTGEHSIPAPREAVWAALHDPVALRACIPGCEAVERDEEGAFAGRATARMGDATNSRMGDAANSRMGDASIAFTGRLVITAEDFPLSYSLAGHADGGAAGRIDAEGTVSLTAVADGTVVGYRVRLVPSGRMARLGSGVLHGAAIRVGNEFFSRLIERLGTRPARTLPLDMAEPLPHPRAVAIAPIAPAPAPVASTQPEPGPPPPEPEPFYGEPNPRTRHIIVVGGLVFYVIVLLLLFWPRG